MRDDGSGAVRELVGIERRRVIDCQITMVEQHDSLGLSCIPDLKIVGGQVGDRISAAIDGDHVQINQLGSRGSRLRVLKWRKPKDQRNGDGEYHKPPSLTE